MLALFAVFISGPLFAAPLDRASALIAPHLEGLREITEEGAASLRLRFSTEPAVISGAAWDSVGSLRFPPNGLPHVSETEMLDQIDALYAVMEGSGDGIWVSSGPTQARLFYCESTSRVCLMLDSAAMAAPLGLPDAQAVRTALVESSGGSNRQNWLWPIGAVLALGLFWWRRGSIRRASAQTFKQDPDSFSLADLTVHPRKLVAHRSGRDIDLTARDVKILEHFSQHRGEVISKDALYDVGWGRDFMPNSRALDQHIVTLRRKLDPDKAAPQIIETVHGQGYRTPE